MVMIFAKLRTHLNFNEGENIEIVSLQIVFHLVQIETHTEDVCEEVYLNF